jgi:predicted metal-dependent HD superfamily phosphohydrolase
VKYKDNEEEAVEYAKKILPNFGCNESDFLVVKECILATKIPQTPKSKLSEIVCDADLDYLGRDDFFYISDKLQNEWINYGLISGDIDEWNQIQINFMENHEYFTKTCKSINEPIKKRNLESIRATIKQ